MKSADQDSVTGLADQHRFDRELSRAWLNAQKTGTPLSLLFCDIDRFKGFNDYYGHAAGDACLRQVAQRLQATLRRPTDLAAQYEGGKFVVLLPCTEAHDALIIADRMLAGVRSLAIPHEQSDAARVVTISIGGHSLWPVPGLSARTIITKLAETRLVEAKHCGRNQSRLSTTCRDLFEN